ncbi:class E basic helix-loop-helix protein 41 [Anolis sagrei]|uniref:class E basic helix-loop-helix protein 41 n=1 Tax=Anolis sagrei TaxID=38937 RepID=UPI00351FCD62
MEEGRAVLEPRDFLGMDYPSLYLCKPKRGMKRDDSKDTYKLPHRLIEKKRRDRINECIAQLKDLLPEHLKLTTLGHLEKAVVLELTLKHLKALTALTEQQHQKIIALQNGERSPKSPLQSDLDAFHSGFQTCTKEVLQYLSRFESWAAREQRCVQLIGHLHAVCARFLPGTQLPVPKGSMVGKDRAESHPNCVPVIQRTQSTNSSGAGSAAAPNGHHLAGNGNSSVELGGENDTDTDSGYGGEGEGEKVRIKQELPGEDAPPKAKRLKLDCVAEQAAAALLRPDPTLLSSLMALGGLGNGAASPFGQPPAAPFCLPFYFLSPSAAAYMQPFLDKSSLDKYLYQTATAPIPLLYPGIPAPAFPCLSSVLAPAEKASASASSALLSPDLASPSQPLPALFSAGIPSETEPPSPEQPSPSSGEEEP